MTKAISIRLDPDILTFLDTNFSQGTRTDRIRAVLLWLKRYQAHYLGSVQEHLELSLMPNPERLSEKS